MASSHGVDLQYRQLQLISRSGKATKKVGPTRVSTTSDYPSKAAPRPHENSPQNKERYCSLSKTCKMSSSSKRRWADDSETSQAAKYQRTDSGDPERATTVHPNDSASQVEPFRGGHGGNPHFRGRGGQYQGPPRGRGSGGRGGRGNFPHQPKYEHTTLSEGDCGIKADSNSDMQFLRTMEFFNKNNPTDGSSTIQGRAGPDGSLIWGRVPPENVIDRARDTFNIVHTLKEQNPGKQYMVNVAMHITEVQADNRESQSVSNFSKGFEAPKALSNVGSPALQQNARKGKFPVCKNCLRTDHDAKVCVGPYNWQEAALRFCPLCNSKAHLVEDCSKVREMEEKKGEQYAAERLFGPLITDRANRPQIGSKKYTMPALLRACPAKAMGLQPGDLPWTREHARFVHHPPMWTNFTYDDSFSLEQQELPRDKDASVQNILATGDIQRYLLSEVIPDEKQSADGQRTAVPAPAEETGDEVLTWAFEGLAVDTKMIEE